MRVINYDIIKNNLCKVLKSNDVILVIKDNAYNFGIEEIVSIAKNCGVNFFAVKNIEEGILIRKIDSNVKILFLGKCKEVLLLKKYNIIGTINDYDDYIRFKENKIEMHLEIDFGMNRFGVKNGYLALINDKAITYIYTHLYNENNKLEKIRLIEDLGYRYQKNVHIGGSMAYGHTKKSLRIGRMIYENSTSLIGNVINIKRVYKGEFVGYDQLYQVDSNCLVGIVNIGYSDGLYLFYDGNVCINKNRYKVIGKCCMDCCFVLIDELVDIGDVVEFYGKNISEDEFCKNNKMSKYELFFLK